MKFNPGPKQNGQFISDYIWKYIYFEEKIYILI